MITLDPTKNLGPIGSAVLTFIGYKQTNKHQNKLTDRQAKFINRYSPTIALALMSTDSHALLYDYKKV